MQNDGQYDVAERNNRQSVGSEENYAGPGAPFGFDEHEQPGWSAERLGQVHQGRADAPAGADAERGGARPRAPIDADECK